MSSQQQQKLPPNVRRLQTIILAGPLMVVSSYILYKRLVLGEEQKRFVKPVSGMEGEGEYVVVAGKQKLGDTFIAGPSGSRP